MAIVEKNGKYCVVEYYRDNDGKLKQKWTSGFYSREEAECFSSGGSKTAFFGDFFLPEGKHSALSEYLEKWLVFHAEKHDLSLNTVNGYRNCIKHISKYIGKKRLDELSVDQIEYLFFRLSKESAIGGTTRLYIYRVLNNCFKYATRKGHIDFNYCSSIDPPRKNKVAYTWLNKDSIRILSEYLLSSPNTTESTFLLLALLLGLRRGEIYGIRWKDIDFQNNTVSISRSVSFSKGGYFVTDCKTQKSQRSLFLPSAISDRLSLLAKVSEDFSSDPDGFVFINPNTSKFYTISCIQKYYKQCLKDCSLPDIRIHDLRHSFASYLINEQKAPISVVSQMLGHSNISTTLNIYTHTDTDLQKAAVSSIDALVGRY